MKALKNILAFIIAMGIGGCSDFLDKDPTDQLSSNLFWQSKADFDNGLTALYGSLQGEMFSYGAPNWDALTDNAYGQHNYYGSNALVQGNIFPSSGGYISSIYLNAYTAIARVNNFLEKLGAYTGNDITTETRQNYEGEAQFIRAFFYFYLYHNYGEVPIVTETLNLENQHQPKSDSEVVFGQIIEDLEGAINKLPAIPYSESGGHVVKSSADAFMVRVLLYNAYDDNGNAKADIMQKAQLHAQAVIDAGYQLDEIYTDVFRDGTQEGNEEIIFSIKFLAPDNFTAMDQWYGDWLVISPLQNLVDDYEYKDGLPLGESPLTNFEEPFVDRDPRLAQTIFEDHVDFGDGNTHMPSNNRPTGYGLAKFLTPDLIPYGYATRSQQDWVALRYADILLMMAEIENELAGPNTLVYEAVNSVRERAGMPPLPEGLPQANMRDRIRHERRIELAFEGLRYYDLKRWKIAETVLNNVNDGVVPYQFEEKFYHWPLPQSEIDRSNGILVQNPNY